MPKNDSIVVDKTPVVEDDKKIGVDSSIDNDIGKGKVNDPTMTQIP